jgi:adenylate cyclase
MATDRPGRESRFDELWRAYLNGGEEALQEFYPAWMRPLIRFSTHGFALIPSSPRCVWCNAPFRGPGAPLMKVIGKGQSNYNPSICQQCEELARRHEGGAEVALTMLFADVRGSTTLAEEMDPVAFSKLINRFYKATTDVLIRSNAMIDKLIGDEVAAFYVPGFAGAEHARVAIEAARQLLRVTGHEEPEGPWIPVGAGVHSGVAYVGAVGSADGVTDITVLGDVPNAASRLASQAGPGEVLVSMDSWMAAGFDDPEIEMRTLRLKGRAEPLSVAVVRVGPPRGTT